MSDDLIGLIIRDVAELPGRSSPDGQTDTMLVTSVELRDILECRLSPPQPPPELAELVKRLREWAASDLLVKARKIGDEAADALSQGQKDWR